MYSDKLLELLLEYGPGWRSDLLQDIHSSCNDMFSYPVFCRDGVFWSNKLLLAAVSKMMAVAISTSDPESCLVIPDLSRHDLKHFYDTVFRDYDEIVNMSSIRNVANTFAVETLIDKVNNWEEDEDDEEETTPDLFDCLKKSDKIKLSQYFDHDKDSTSEEKGKDLELQLKPFRQNCFQCKICHRKFCDSSQLERHTNFVHAKKAKNSEMNNPYKCPKCDRRFAYNCNVRRHIWLHHKHENIEIDKTKPHTKIINMDTKCASRKEKLEDIKCNLCNKYFPSWKRLQLHMYDHTTDRPFNCQECGKGFKEESKLKRHSLIHSGMKPFQCSYCNKTFSLKQNKDIHERLHTGTGFQCQYCMEMFSQKVNLKKHELKHEKLNHIKTNSSELKEKQTIGTVKNKLKTYGNKREQQIILINENLIDQNQTLKKSDEAISKIVFINSHDILN